MYKFFCRFFVLSIICSCASISHQNNSGRVELSNNVLYSPLLVQTQLAAPQSIKSITLYRKGNSSNPPVIKLGTDNKLMLEFDELSSLHGQFAVRFTHHNQDWSSSNLPDFRYVGGINNLVIQNGEKNDFSKPGYYHYSFEFPNNQIEFLISGNYLLHVYDFASNTELFSIPFFVSEETGKITSSSETVYHTGGLNSAINQLFTVYEYPKEIMFPQFDLTAVFAQNRFWAHSITATEKDAADAGVIRFHTPREHSFPAGFDFIPLDLSELNIDNRRIIDWQPEFTPPRIILREDVLNFAAAPTPQYLSNYGYPQRGSSSRYASVYFSLDPGRIDDPETEIYVTGDFNQWALDRQNRLAKNSETGLWETSIVIKQGRYRYKYFLKNNYTKPDFIPLNDAITSTTQEYAGFIYYTDPDYNYQRLLMTTFFSIGN